MDARYVVIVVLAGISALGVIRLVARHGRLAEQSALAYEYLSKFNTFANSYTSSFYAQLYFWLVSKSDKIQSQMGFCGIADYRPPFANYIMRNYQILVNTLPQMRTRKAMADNVAMCEDALIRYIGLIDDSLAYSASRLKNPLVWLQEGARLILAIPIITLQWVGLISPTKVDAVTLNPLFRVFSGIVLLLGLVASLLTIILGWEKLIELL